MGVPYLDLLSSPLVELILAADLCLGIFTNGWGLAKIEWRLTIETYHVLNFLTFIFFVTALIVILLLIYYRKGNTIYSSNYLFSIYVSYFMLFLSILGLFLLFVSFYNVSKDFVEASKIIATRHPDKAHILTGNGQWFILIASQFLTIVFEAGAVVSWYSVLERLKLKVEGAINERNSYNRVEVGQTDDVK